jgi:eukaryotic-like serine/threonine-protein kinase
MDPNKGIELPPGTKISFYEVLPAVTGEQGEVLRTCIGYGGFGALYRVSRGSKVFALKLAHQPLSAYSAAERQWVEERGDREIATLKSLRHPNIVRVHAFDRWPDDEGRAFIVMDFVDGERLDVWRAKHSPSVRRICEVFIAIARALHTAHKQDIHHRDLKCANVLVRLLDGQPVIVDWGISKPGSAYTITRVNATMGTSTHFAPEYCRWALSPDNTRFETTPPTELHSVGYMLYELLTGRAPFPFAENEVELMRTIITMDRGNGLETPSELNHASPKELDAVVMRLLEKEPEKRYQSGEELAANLEDLLAHAPATWDSPLDVPAVAGSNSTTRADRGQLQHSVLELSKDDDAGVNGSAPKPAQMSIRSLERPGFLSIEAPAPIAAHAAPLAPPLPDAVKAAAEKVRATAGARRRVRPAMAVGIGLGVVLVGVVAVAIAGHMGRRQPENLLARIEQQEQLPLDARGTGHLQVAQPVPEASVLPPAPRQQLAPSALETKGTTLSAAERRTPAERSDSAAIQAAPPRPRDIATSANAKRRVVAAASSARPAEDDDQPAWLKPVQSTVPAQRANAKFGVPTGAHIRARLVTNLDSRTVGAGPVEAKLMRPFLLDGRSVFPSGTVLIGNAATAGSRFTIRFVLLRLPDNREVPFEGLAYDLAERKPGLAATRKMEGAPNKTDGLASKIVKETANTVLTAASSGNLGATLATGAGRTIVNDQGQDSTTLAGEGTVLLLDAPADLEVFVTRAM